MDIVSRLPPFARFALDVQRRYGEDYGGYLAATITYYAFFSLFPLLLVALSVIGFTLADDPAAQAEWAERLGGAVPGLAPLIGDNIGSIVAARAGTGLVGLAGLLWSSMAVIRASGFALSRVFRVAPYDGFVKQTKWVLGSAVTLGVLGIAGVAVAGFAGSLRIPGTSGALVVATGLAAALVIDVAVFLAAYRILTQRQGPPFRDLWPGALFAGAGWAVLKVGGTWYASRTIARTSAVYGTFATTIGVLVLLYLAARLFVYGAEISAVRLERRGHRFPRIDTGVPPQSRPSPRTGFDRAHGPGLETRGAPVERSERRRPA